MTFRDLVEASSGMTPDEFSEKVQEAFHKHFPNGYTKIIQGKGLVVGSITGYFGMIGEVSDNNHGYHDNDKMKHNFVMFPHKDGLTYEFKGSGKIYIKPAEGSYNAMDSIKTGMGNVSSITLEKAFIKLDKFFKKLSDLMEENKDKIYGVDTIKPKYLVFK